MGGMTNGRMVGAAALASVYFGLLFATLVAVGGAIEAANFNHSTSLETLVAGALPALWIPPVAVPVAAVACLAMGFPIGLIARRLIGPTQSVARTLGAAFAVGAIACTVVLVPVVVASSFALADAPGEVRPNLAESLVSLWWWVLVAAVSSVLGLVTVLREGSARAVLDGRCQ